MKLKVVLLIFLLSLPSFIFLTATRKADAAVTSIEPVLAMDMEQFIVLPNETGTVQRSWLFDSSPYRNHGQPLPYSSPTYGGPTKVRGVFAYAMNLCLQTDYIEIADFQGLPNDEITIMAWMYGSSLSTDVFRRIVKHEWNNNGSWLLYIDGGADPTLKFGVVNAGNQYTASYSGLESETWYYITGVYNGSHVTCYLNGEEGTPAALAGATLDNNGTVRIDDTVSWFNGVLDEVKIFPYALTEQEIKMEMYDQIFVHKQNRWWEYQNDTTDGPYFNANPNTSRMGLTNNDPTLPWSVNPARIKRLDYVPGFQSFEFNLRLNGTAAGSADWFITFFKNGLWQSRYKIELYWLDASPATEWVAIFYYETHTGGWSETISYKFNCSSSQVLTEWPFVVQAWTTEDSRQIALRVTSKNATEDGIGKYMFWYYFDLVDGNDNSQYLEWFDPWVVRAFSVRGGFEVVFHNWDLIESVIRAFKAYITMGPLVAVPVLAEMRAVVSGQEPTVWGDPNDNATDGAPDPLFDPIGYLGWTIRHALSDLGINLDPIVNAIRDAVGTGLLKFWEILVDFLDTVFTAFGWTNGFSQLLSWIGSFLTWIVDSFTNLIALLTSGFTFVASFITKMLNALSNLITTWVSMVQGIFDILGGAYSGTVNLWETLNLSDWYPIVAVLYCLWLFALWEKDGTLALFNHIQKVLDIFTWIGNMFITVIQVFLAVIGRLIESVPVVE